MSFSVPESTYDDFAGQDQLLGIVAETDVFNGVKLVFFLSWVHQNLTEAFENHRLP